MDYHRMDAGKHLCRIRSQSASYGNKRYDASANRRRTVIDYGQYAQYGLPYWVKEYAADGATVIRQTFTDYNLSQAYLDRRIIGLVSQVHLKNAGSYESKITYDYDDPSQLQSLPAAATQHDGSYNTSFTTRGNLTGVSRWDVNDINNASKKLTTYTNYFITGSPGSSTDPCRTPEQYLVHRFIL